MANKFDEAMTRLADATKGGLLSLALSDQTVFANEVYDHLKVDAAARFAQGGQQMESNCATKLQSFGSIGCIDLPPGYGPIRPNTDTGSLSMDEAPKLYQAKADPDAKIGLWHRDLKQADTLSGLHDIFQKPPHALSDDEYFKISGLMTPGPWSGNGRGHEISMRTDEINGKKVVVYDYWMGKDPAKDTPMSQMGPDDIRCRVVFVPTDNVLVPNDKTQKLDIMWMQAPNKEFNKRSAEFERSLNSIHWK